MAQYYSFTKASLNNGWAPQGHTLRERCTIKQYSYQSTPTGWAIGWWEQITSTQAPQVGGFPSLNNEGSTQSTVLPLDVINAHANDEAHHWYRFTSLVSGRVQIRVDYPETTMPVKLTAYNSLPQYQYSYPFAVNTQTMTLDVTYNASYWLRVDFPKFKQNPNDPEEVPANAGNYRLTMAYQDIAWTPQEFQMDNNVDDTFTAHNCAKIISSVYIEGWAAENPLANPSSPTVEVYVNAYAGGAWLGDKLVSLTWGVDTVNGGYKVYAAYRENVWNGDWATAAFDDLRFKIRVLSTSSTTHPTIKCSSIRLALSDEHNDIEYDSLVIKDDPADDWKYKFETKDDSGVTKLRSHRYKQVDGCDITEQYPYCCCEYACPSLTIAPGWICQATFGKWLGWDRWILNGYSHLYEQWMTYYDFQGSVVRFGKMGNTLFDPRRYGEEQSVSLTRTYSDIRSWWSNYARMINEQTYWANPYYPLCGDILYNPYTWQNPDQPCFPAYNFNYGIPNVSVTKVTKDGVPTFRVVVNLYRIGQNPPGTYRYVGFTGVGYGNPLDGPITINNLMTKESYTPDEIAALYEQYPWCVFPNGGVDAIGGTATFSLSGGCGCPTAYVFEHMGSVDGCPQLETFEIPASGGTATDGQGNVWGFTPNYDTCGNLTNYSYTLNGDYIGGSTGPCMWGGVGNYSNNLFWWNKIS